MGLKASKLAASHEVVGFDEKGNELEFRGQFVNGVRHDGNGDGRAG
jgi:hypothetical protein